jgi:hypothetical protein
MCRPLADIFGVVSPSTSLFAVSPFAVNHAIRRVQHGFAAGSRGACVSQRLDGRGKEDGQRASSWQLRRLTAPVCGYSAGSSPLGVSVLVLSIRDRLKKQWKLVEQLTREDNAGRTHGSASSAQRLRSPRVAGMTEIVRSGGGVEDALRVGAGSNTVWRPLLIRDSSAARWSHKNCERRSMRCCDAGIAKRWRRRKPFRAPLAAA